MKQPSGRAICGGLVVAAVLLAGRPAVADDHPAWAYAQTPRNGAFDSTTLKHVPGSTQQFTPAQIEDNFSPPDWFPGDHPPMPGVVAQGRPPAVWACSKCHGPNGAGHPESSDLAGLPIPYIQSQMAAFQTGERKGGRAGAMVPIAKAASDAEILEAAQYFTGLRSLAFTKIVEADTAPKTHIGVGGMRLPDDGGGTEPLGARIIVVPVEPEQAELRDPRVEFVAYVPLGSIARGAALVGSGGDGETAVCATCHGADLRGAGAVPSISGRAPLYIFRQLNDIKIGSRSGAGVQPMMPVVAKLDQDDMIAIAAYLATRAP
jgi:cytochrome c553